MIKMLSSSKLLERLPSLRLRSARQFSQTTTLAAAIFNKIAFLGTGKMAQAMIEPLIKTGLQPASQIHVYDVSSSAMKAAATKYGIQTSKSPADVVQGADLVVCAVKPQNLTTEFFESLGQPSAHTTLLSVIAGKPMSTFTSGGFTKVARSMPNTPAQIGQGMTGTPQRLVKDASNAA
jgi:pyrroline-5-carboxylate reductase